MGGAGEKMGHAGEEVGQRWGAGVGSEMEPHGSPSNPIRKQRRQKLPRDSKSQPGSTDEPRTAKYRSSSELAAGQQHRTLQDGGKGGTPTPICLGLAGGAQMSLSGEGGSITDQAGGTSAPTNHPIFPILQGLTSGFPSLCHQCFGNPAWKQAMLSWGWGNC